MAGLQAAQEAGQGPQCCRSSPLSLKGCLTVQSAKKLLVSSRLAASTRRAVTAPWISVSQTTGKPSSFNREFAAQGIMPISVCRAFQHWMAPALQPYLSARFFMATFRAAIVSSSASVTLISKFSRQKATVSATFVPSSLAVFMAAVSSDSGMGESWILNFSRSSPSLHMVDQNSFGLGPICRIRIFRKVFTTLQTARNRRMPSSKAASSRLQLVRYVKGTRKRRSTLPVAKRPHWLSLKRMPFSSGHSSLGPHRSTGTFMLFASLATSNSVPKLPWGKNRPSTFSFLNFSSIRSRSFSSCSSPSSAMSSMSTNSTPISSSFFLVRLAYSTAAGAEKMLLLVGAKPSLIFFI